MDFEVSPLGQVMVIGVGLWAVNSFVLSVYLHRYIAHRSFVLTLPGRVLCRFLLYVSFTFRRHEWVGIHRVHHRTAGTPEDPHPSEELGTWRAFAVGLWFWHRAATDPEIWRPAVSDIPEDRLDRFHSRLPILGPAVLVTVLVWGFGWRVALAGFVLNQILILLLQMAVVSFTHTFGRQPRPVPGHDSHLVSLFLWGEGYHNNHHHRPRSPDMARGIPGFDYAFLVIRAMTWVGLARLPARPPRLPTPVHAAQPASLGAGGGG